MELECFCLVAPEDMELVCICRQMDGQASGGTSKDNSLMKQINNTNSLTHRKVITVKLQKVMSMKSWEGWREESTITRSPHP
jgi:hypothetical protein